MYEDIWYLNFVFNIIMLKSFSYGDVLKLMEVVFVMTTTKHSL